MKTVSAALAAAVMFVVVLPASAGTLVTWNFKGTWSNIEGSPQQGFTPLPAVGDAMTLSVTFDSAASKLNDCDGDPTQDNCSVYSNALLSFVFTSPSCTDGGVCASSAPDTAFAPGNRIFVYNDGNPANGADGMQFRLYDQNGLLWRLFLYAATNDVLTSTALPSVFNPGLMTFSSQFTVCDPDPAAANCTGATTRIDAFQTLAYVPEPGSLALLGLGLAGLAAVRRRRN